MDQSLWNFSIYVYIKYMLHSPDTKVGIYSSVKHLYEYFWVMSSMDFLITAAYLLFEKKKKNYGTQEKV